MSSDPGPRLRAQLDLEPIKAREAAATAADLRLMRYDHGGGRLAQFSPRPKRGPLDDGEDRQLIADFYDEANREFYYHARIDIPALLEEIAILRASASPIEETNYWGAAIGCLADEVARLKAEEFLGRRDKWVSVLRNAAYRLNVAERASASAVSPPPHTETKEG